MFPRQSGIVCHLTSLPGPYGIGEAGSEACWFADQLRSMGQKLWQVLPLGPTSYGDSPYQCLSSFAGNPLLISLNRLVEENLLNQNELKEYPIFDPDNVDYGPLIQARKKMLHILCAKFDTRSSTTMRTDYEQFRHKQAYWLDDYSLFAALKEAHGGSPWTEWEPELRSRDTHALNKARNQLAESIEAVAVQQYLFERHWNEVRTYCNEQGIEIIGDLPIFVAHDSADVWSDPGLFYLDSEGQCTSVAGVPPDYFSETGQRWGNPLYRWEQMKEDGYAWWKRRMKRVLEQVDRVRIDHFRGFEAYWEIPVEEPTAVNGQWVEGPGMNLFEAFREELGALPIIAEDLGVITDGVEKLLADTGFPGMKVLQFTFAEDPMPEKNKPHNFPENSVCYTATHDNDTTVGWYQNLRASAHEHEGELRNLYDYLQTDGENLHEKFIAMAWRSPSLTALTTMQDLLGLDTGARLNLPGRPGGNWRWRFTREQLTHEMQDMLRKITQETKRGI